MNDLLNDLMDIGDEDIADANRMNVQRAPFAMPGAKFRSVEMIVPLLPIKRDSTWVEHCGGTGVISWNVPQCKVMVFNDRYSGITAFYHAVRDKKDLLLAYLSSMPPHSREEWTHCRHQWVNETDDVARAAKWYYMMRLSVLQKGKAFGRGITTRFIPLPSSLKLFEHVHQVLQNFTIENLDIFMSITDYDDVNTIHYIDIPYIGTDQGAYEGKWDWPKVTRLLDLIKRLKGFVAFSHYPDPRIRKYLDWTHIYEWDVLVTAEPKIFRDTNFKEGKENVTNNATARECLYIKEPN